MIAYSFIVPVYNSAETIRRCLESILNAVKDNIELLIIDDGSTDGSTKICDDYSKNDPRIRIIHKANGGQASARNVGINIAKGKYILFCDSDDYYDSAELSNLLKMLPDEPSENTLYAFNFRNVWLDHVEEKSIYPAADVVFGKQGDNIEFFSSRKSHKTMGYAIWDKVYCKSVIDNYQIRMPERDTMGHKDDWAEDLFFNLSYGQHISHVKVFESPAYMLRKHGTPKEQNENRLISRTEHMMDFFSNLIDSYSISVNQYVADEFWKIVIWHMKRYFDLDCSYRGEKGLDSLRNEYKNSKHWEMLSQCIKTALKNWKDYGQRWDYMHRNEYYYFLKYIIDGNKLMFKVRNKLLYTLN